MVHQGRDGFRGWDKDYARWAMRTEVMRQARYLRLLLSSFLMVLFA